MIGILRFYGEKKTNRNQYFFELRVHVYQISGTVYFMVWSHGLESWSGVMEWSIGVNSWSRTLE